MPSLRALFVRIVRAVHRAALDTHRDEQSDRVSGIELVGVIIGVLTFVAVLSIRLPSAFLKISPTRLGWLFALAFVLLSVLTTGKAIAREEHRRFSMGRFPILPHRATRAALSVAAFMLVALPLANAWRDGGGGLYSIGAVVPWSDASAYYSGAVSLSEFKKLDDWNERRPINAAFNSVKLRIGRGVQGWIVVGALLIAFGLAILAREVALMLGAAPAAVMLGTIVGHGGEYWATTMSENNGLLLGLLATAAFVFSIRVRDLRWFWSGCFLIGLALDARAGAFVVIPLLWLWGFVAFGASLRRRVGITVAAVFITVAAFLPARLYDSLWGTGHGRAHGNFSWTLYGIAAGNRGWGRVFQDYPQIGGFADERQQTAFVYHRALDLIRANPVRFATFLLQGVRAFVVGVGAPYLNLDWRASLLTLLLCLVRWRDSLSIFVIAVFIGNALSAPFLVWDAGPRLFVATVPAAALTAAIAVAFVERSAVEFMANGTALTVARSQESLVPEWRPAAVAAGLGLILVVAPLILPATHARELLPLHPSVEEPSLLVIRGSSGEWVDVLPNEALPAPSTRAMRADQFFTNIMQTDMAVAARSVRPPFSFGLAIAQRKPPETWLLTRSGLLLPRKGALLLSGEWRTASRYRYMLVHGVWELSSDGRSWARMISR